MQYASKACNYYFLRFFQCILPDFRAFLNTSHLWKIFLIFFYAIIQYVGEVLSTLITISDWSDPYIMEKTLSVKEEMNGKMFISRQSRHISFVIIIIKVLFPSLYLSLACKQFCLPPRKMYIWEKLKYSGRRSLISLWLQVDCTDCD